MTEKKKEEEKKGLDFSDGWPKNEEGNAVTVDLFKGKSWPGEHWLHIWRDDEFVFICIDNFSVTFSVDDFIDIGFLLNLVGRGIQGCIPDHVERFMENELKERNETIADYERIAKEEEEKEEKDKDKKIISLN